MQRTEMDPVHQQVQVQTDATDWDGSGSSTSSSSTRCNGLGWIRFINKFKFKQMQRTGMDPVHQQVQVQTDATDWDGSGSSTSSSSNRCSGLGCTRLINRLDPVQTLVYTILCFASF